MSLLDDKIVYSKKALAVFSVKQRNMILKAAMQDAAEVWMMKFLPKRFDKKYMERAPFNHRVKDLSFKQKLKKAIFQGQKFQTGKGYDFDRLQPLVMSGRMKQSVLSGSRAVTRSPGGKVRAQIKIPLSHPVRTEVASLIRRLHPREINVIAHTFERNVTNWIKAGSVVKTKSGKVAKKSGIARRSLTGASSNINSRRMR